MTDEKLRSRAYAKVRYAVISGKIIKPNICELCGEDVTKKTIDDIFGVVSSNRIVAHHWNGYKNPLDVWWICASCNRRLLYCHDGSLTKSDAIKIVSDRSATLIR